MSKPFGNCRERLDRQVSLAAFNPTHICAMEPAVIGERLLGEWPATAFHNETQPLTEDLPRDTSIPKGTEITAHVTGDMKLDATTLKGQSEKPTVAATPHRSETSAVPSAPSSPAPTPSGIITVRFTSTPSNAEIDIDGNYWGSTPTADLTRLPAGTHTITVKKLGYKPWERKIELAPGDDRTVNAELEIDPTKPRIAGLN